MVGLGLLLQARAESGQGHAREGEKLAASAVTPLAFGMGPDHPLTREARALADSLRPGARPTPR